MKPRHHSKPAMTKAGLKGHAFMALVLGDPERIQRESIKASTKLTDDDLAELERRIEAARLG